MTLLRRMRVAVLPLLLLTGACAQQDAPSGAGEPAAAYPDDVPVVRMAYTGGFVSPITLATRLPAVSVYGDGRVIAEGPVPAIYPGPALPNVQVAKIDAGAVAELVAQARAAGVGTAQDLGTPSITDVAATRFTVRGPVGTEELEVYALAEATGPESGLSAEQRAARDRLRAFAEKLTGLSGTDPQLYQPTAVVAVAQKWTAGGEVGKQAEVAWPGPELPGESIGDGLGLGCVTVTGAAVRQLLDAAGTANAATPWTSGGKRWTVALRPLLPDETGCGDLASRS
ncbi:hypothetical protein E1258_27435 [Micromonospora sp. KC207]|uniref:hypothetical protein n=1 Tax=Micromonospora sp. KC207 TaxID=2530377 RepID=UPI00104AD434|nr:hypothetical protein E1258_27435 [Micromonospora sp. KC207]